MAQPDIKSYDLQAPPGVAVLDTGKEAIKLAARAWTTSEEKALECLQDFHKSGRRIHKRGWNDPLRYLQDLSKVSDSATRLEHLCSDVNKQEAQSCSEYKLEELQRHARRLEKVARNFNRKWSKNPVQRMIGSVRFS